MSIAKFVFGLVMVVGLGQQALACGGSALDCRIGNDKVGGKFCHYTVSACADVSCDKAIACTVEKWSRAVVKAIAVSASSVKVNFSKPMEDLGANVQMHMVKSHGASCKSSSCEIDSIVLTDTAADGMCSVLSIQ
jgi:hypothetical protein